jgi:hypothetical protein
LSGSCLIGGLFNFRNALQRGEVKVCRIRGPRVGAKPSLPASRSPLYSSAPGLKLAVAHRSHRGSSSMGSFCRCTPWPRVRAMTMRLGDILGVYYE